MRLPTIQSNQRQTCVVGLGDGAGQLPVPGRPRLLLHIVGQGPAVLAAGAGGVGYIFV